MSVYYTVDEKFMIPAVTEAHGEFVEILASHCAALVGDRTIPNCTSFLKMHLEVDGKVYQVDESATLSQCAQAFGALMSAKQFSLTIRYEYRWSVGRDTSYVGFHEWLDFISKADDEFLSTVYCAFYNSADCADTDEPGCLVAYGRKDGTILHGEVPFVPVETAPEGQWIHPQTAALFDSDGDAVEPSVIQKLTPYFQRLTKLSQYDDLSVDESGYYYAMNNIELHNHEEVLEYADCITAISELLGSDCFCGVDKLFDSKNSRRILHLVTDGTRVVGFGIVQA